MIETILIAIQAKLNKTSFHATEKNSQKVFISKAYCYRHITNLTFIKKKYVPEVYHVYKHANQHGMK